MSPTPPVTAGRRHAAGHGGAPARRRSRCRCAHTAACGGQLSSPPYSIPSPLCGGHPLCSLLSAAYRTDAAPPNAPTPRERERGRATACPHRRDPTPRRYIYISTLYLSLIFSLSLSLSLSLSISLSLTGRVPGSPSAAERGEAVGREGGWGDGGMESQGAEPPSAARQRHGRGWAARQISPRYLRVGAGSAPVPRAGTGTGRGGGALTGPRPANKLTRTPRGHSHVSAALCDRMSQTP